MLWLTKRWILRGEDLVCTFWSWRPKQPKGQAANADVTFRDALQAKQVRCMGRKAVGLKKNAMEVREGLQYRNLIIFY